MGKPKEGQGASHPKTGTSARYANGLVWLGQEAGGPHGQWSSKGMTVSEANALARCIFSLTGGRYNPKPKRKKS